MTKYFVTGGAGVIGQELVERLLIQGNEVIVGDIKKQPKKFSGRVEYWQMDLNNLTISKLRKSKPNFVIHLAATFERSIETKEFWAENFNHNVRLSNHIATLSSQIPTIEKLIFASSYLVYDSSRYLFQKPQLKATSLSTNAPLLPRNLVGAAKLFHERELEFLSKFLEPQMKIVSARIYRGYGRGSRDIISRWVRSALAGEELTAHNVAGMFDYIYARDSADALLALIDSNAVGTYDVGTGKPHRVEQVLDQLSKEFLNLRVLKAAETPIYEASCADITRISTETGWQPKVSLAQGVKEIVEFETSLLREKKKK